jgi:hypothetical protein
VPALQQAWTRHRQGEQDERLLLWTWLSLEHWMQHAGRSLTPQLV